MGCLTGVEKDDEAPCFHGEERDNICKGKKSGYFFPFLVFFFFCCEKPFLPLTYLGKSPKCPFLKKWVVTEIARGEMIIYAKGRSLDTSSRF